MQITITPEQIHATREFLDLVILPVFSWMIGRLKLKLNEVVTENTNRIRQELCDYIDTKFVAHETHAFARLTSMEQTIKDATKP